MFWDHGIAADSYTVFRFHMMNIGTYSFTLEILPEEENNLDFGSVWLLF